MQPRQELVARLTERMSTGRRAGDSASRFVLKSALLMVGALVLLFVLPFLLVKLEGPAVRRATARSLNENTTTKKARGEEAPARSTNEPSPAELPEPARDILTRIRTGGYSSRSEVATGAFLAEFDRKGTQLDDVDGRELRYLRHGSDWIQVEARYRPPVTDSDCLARLRFRKQGGAWKLESLRVLRGRRF